MDANQISRELTEAKDEFKNLLTRFNDLSKALNINSLKERVQTLDNILQDPLIWKDNEKARTISEQYGKLKNHLEGHDQVAKKLSDLEVLIELAQEQPEYEVFLEISTLLKELSNTIMALELENLLSDEFDQMDAICEIHAGAGGTDAQDWAEMLLKMYLRWAQKKGFKVEIDEITPGQEAGILSATFIVSGKYAYGYLSCEKGVHRLVRISPFDSAHRRHTSFASVDATPLLEMDFSKIEIPDDELRIDTYRSSGAGGQHVNVTDSAVRITHIPTGIVVSCQNERSQFQNKQRAMQILYSKLAELKRQEMQKKLMQISGPQADISWGNQIRSYVLAPYQLVKDSRTNVETGNVEAVLDGEIDEFIQAELIRQRSKQA